ncbi:MAG TPA: OmpA family protein, partial [Longimicrobiales bacterium]|nr:OmpA family protein [Longimicrobiales bacterium]
LLPQVAEAQIGRRLRDTARRAAERETHRQVDRQVTNVVRCVLTDQACIDKARAEGQEVQIVDADGNEVADPSSGPAAQRVGEGAWANYDFVPGERVLFADDFRSDRIGNFPRRAEFVAGSLELVDWQGTPYLRSTAESAFTITLPETLPDRFTIEFDLHTGALTNDVKVLMEPQGRSYDVSMYRGGTIFLFGRRSGITSGMTNQGIQALSQTPQMHDTMLPVRIMVDGAYAKVFLNEQRIANVPNTRIPRTNTVQFWLGGNARGPSLIGNIRIAAGGRALYDALATDGHVSTQGILFDTGSDRIRPESTPTLKEIGEMLRQHASLRLRIEGHTDNVGSAASNQALSERRAVAVREHLLSSYGIDADRLEAVGKGQSEPAESNDTPEGRQNNRRVVLVRL